MSQTPVPAVATNPDGSVAPTPAEAIPAPAPVSDQGTGQAVPTAAPPPPAAPAQGELFKFEELKLPEGLSVPDEMKTELAAFATEGKLDTPKMQKLIEMHHKAVAGSIAQVQNALRQTGEGWADAVRKDPEIGGDKLAGVQGTIAKAIEQFGAPGVKEALNETYAGNHPAIVRTFYNMAKALGEGKFVPGGAPANGQTGPISAAKALFPNLPE